MSLPDPIAPLSAPSAPLRPALASRWRLRWPARFDTLRVKLFLAIAGANALLALLAFVVFSWSFDQGFVEYLNRADENRLQPLVARLAEGYKKEGSWTWIAQDRRRWGDLVREVFGVARSTRRTEDGTPLDVPASDPAAARDTPRDSPRDGPPPDPLLTIDPRLMLFDASRHLLSGRQEMAGEAVLKPIQVDGAVVGFLGYVPRLKMVTSLEQLFSAQQTTKFASIALGMLFAGLLIGAVLAYWLTLRIRRLAQGAGALIQGRYSMRIASQGNDELAHLAKDLNELAQTLEAAQHARQQWIADIAHELRTPLAVLRAEIEALQDGVRPLGQQSLGSLAQEVSQLTRLVDDLRVLSLSDLGALTYYKEPLDLGELIADSIAAQTLALKNRSLSIESHLPDGLRVSGDGARLAQVFGNLLQNTLRYTDDGGRLSVSLGASSAPDDGPRRAVVVWEDSSPGVAPADLPRLTERLFRVDGSRSRVGGGSGLGLAITRAIVEAHGGQMSASASPLGGLRWTLAFPMASSPVTGAPEVKA